MGRRGVWLVAAWFGVACGASEEPPGPDYETVSGEALGTTWTVTWRVVEQASPDAVTRAAQEALLDVDEGMSTWRDDSELALVRRGGVVPVSESTAEVVGAALDLASATGGAFDPTVQPLMEMWGFHGSGREAWPTDEEIAQARAQVGWRRVSLGRDAEGRATVDAGGTALDLSAIAKGYATDRISVSLARMGVTDLFVEVGGEVRAHGRSPRGATWRVGVERPEQQLTRGSLIAGVEFTNRAVATSGNYRNRRRVGDREVHHTLDPRTGMPALSKTLSATVFAPDCRTADGWATALMVLDADEGLALVERVAGVDALLVVDDAGTWRARPSSGVDAEHVRWLTDDVHVSVD